MQAADRNEAALRPATAVFRQKFAVSLVHSKTFVYICSMKAGRQALTAAIRRRRRAARVCGNRTPQDQLIKTQIPMKKALILLLFAMPAAMISASASSACNLCNPLTSGVLDANTTTECNDTVAPFSFSVPDIVEYVREPVLGMVVEEHPDWWYSAQARAWYDYALELKTDETAWRTCYLATHYANNFFYDYDLLASEVAEQIEKYIPGTYTYYYVTYYELTSLESRSEIAEKAIALLPANPTLKDLDTWLCYYLSLYDEAGMERIAKLHLKHQSYPEEVMTHNLNELNGMKPNSIYMATGDAQIIPKLLIIYGQGKHRDKRIVCDQYLTVPEWSKKTFAACGVKKVPELKEDFESMEELNEYTATMAKTLSKLSGRPLYYTFMLNSELADILKGSNEGLVVLAGEKQTMDYKKFKHNWEKVYAKENYLKDMRENAWRTELTFRAQMAMMAERWIPEATEHDPAFAAELQKYVDFFHEEIEPIYYPAEEEYDGEDFDEEDAYVDDAVEKFAHDMYEAYQSFAAEYDEEEVTRKYGKITVDEAEEDETGVYNTLKYLFETIEVIYEPVILKAFVMKLDELETEE